MPTHPYINVTEPPYRAAGNGKKDDTEAFQKALGEAQKTGGVVVAPPGRYRIAGTLHIPSNVTLEGVFQAPPAAAGVPGKGTTLLAYAGRGNINGPPFITLDGPNSTLKGIAVFYPQQRAPEQSAEEIVPYPWSIADKRGGSNNAVIDVLLINSYQGVNFSNGSSRHLIQRLYGQPLFRGIQIDRCLDTGRIEDVHLWPFWLNWSKNEHIREFMARNAIGLILRRSDWQIVHNFFCFGYQIGVRFEKSDQRKLPRPMPNGQFSNLNLDSVGIGLDVWALKSQGVQISNANIALGPYWRNYDDRYAVWGRPQQEGTLSIRGASVWGNFDEVIRWESEGRLLVASSVFDNWKKDNTAIRIAKGRAMVQGNCFTQEVGRSVTVEATADAVTIVHNQLAGNPIEDHGPNTLQAENQL